MNNEKINAKEVAKENVANATSEECCKYQQFKYN